MHDPPRLSQVDALNWREGAAVAGDARPEREFSALLQFLRFAFARLVGCLQQVLHVHVHVVNATSADPAEAAVASPTTEQLGPGTGVQGIGFRRGLLHSAAQVHATLLQDTSLADVASPSQPQVPPPFTPGPADLMAAKEPHQVPFGAYGALAPGSFPAASPHTHPLLLPRGVYNAPTPCPLFPAAPLPARSQVPSPVVDVAAINSAAQLLSDATRAAIPAAT